MGFTGCLRIISKRSKERLFHTWARGGGTTSTYRWVPTFFPKIPVLKGTVPYLGTANFFAHESHCTGGTKKFRRRRRQKFFFCTFISNLYQRYTFFPPFNRKCTSGTDFFAQNFWVYQQYSFFYHFWPILAIFWSFLGKN